MSQRDDGKLRTSRRSFLAMAGALVAGAGAGFTARGVMGATNLPATPIGEGERQAEPFWGKHQGGVLTPVQSYTYFAVFDLTTTKGDDVVKLLQAWTSAAARMTVGQTAELLERELKPVVAHGDQQTRSGSYESYGTPEPSGIAADTGEAIGLFPARLTMTFGFGAGLFVKDGKDRYGLASVRPAALVDLPKFVGDQLVEAHTGGDLSVQACADDPQVAFHAIRQLARIGSNVAKMRWVQTGFIPNASRDQTPRNLMGFKDGTINPPVSDPEAMQRFVWVGNEGPLWMRGGSYVVVRRIRMALEHWDRMTVAFQEQAFGRHKYSGAPLGQKKEFDPLDLNALSKDGNPIIAENAHVRLAAAASNDDAQVLRRPYSYNDGINFTAERWPPWRQGSEYDAGLFFVCYQRDPRTGFIKIYDQMSKFDMLNQFVTHVGGGIFACPGGMAEGEFIGQRLFKST